MKQPSAIVSAEAVQMPRRTSGSCPTSRFQSQGNRRASCADGSRGVAACAVNLRPDTIQQRIGQGRAVLRERGGRARDRSATPPVPPGTPRRSADAPPRAPPIRVIEGAVDVGGEHVRNMIVGGVVIHHLVSRCVPSNSFSARFAPFSLLLTVPTWDTEDIRHFLIGEVVREGEHERLPAVGGEMRHRRDDFRARRRRDGALLRFRQLCREGARLRQCPRARQRASPEGIVRLPAGDADQPCPRARPARETARALPDRDKGVLQDFFGDLDIRGQMQEIGEERLPLAMIELGQRVAIAGRDPRDQLPLRRRPVVHARC